MVNVQYWFLTHLLDMSIECCDKYSEGNCKCDVQVALAWAIVARNALNDNFSFSLNQFVLGHYPALWNVFVNDSPVLEALTVLSSKIIRDILWAMNSERIL